jgi:cyclopropane fatty-acyl-phospholipid synthase-like methyltransferase
MAQVRPSFKKRLHAWWEGYELPSETENDKPQPATSADRLAVVQEIFGEGFSGPGGKEAVVSLIEPLDIEDGARVLEIGAGLGGGARAIAETSGATVTGVDLDPTLVSAGDRQSEAANMEERARILPLDPDDPGFSDEAYRVAVVHDTLYRLKDLPGFIEKTAQALAPGGHLVVADLVLADPQDPTPLSQWHVGEAGAVHPVGLAAVSELVQSAGLEIEESEDLTPAFLSGLIQAWSDFVTKIEQEPPDAKTLPLIKEEADRWARRLTVLQSGDLSIRHLRCAKR